MYPIQMTLRDFQLPVPSGLGLGCGVQCGPKRGVQVDIHLEIPGMETLRIGISDWTLFYIALGRAPGSKMHSVPKFVSCPGLKKRPKKHLSTLWIPVGE